MRTLHISHEKLSLRSHTCDDKKLKERRTEAEAVQ